VTSPACARPRSWKQRHGSRSRLDTQRVVSRSPPIHQLTNLTIKLTYDWCSTSSRGPRLVAFGWAEEHLHRFVIHGREYGIARLGGIGFRDNPHRVALSGFRFRPGERFTYYYDFIADWRLDVRVEQLLSRDPQRAYPVCVGGARAGPPEDCGGPEMFQRRRSTVLVDALVRTAEITDEVLDDPTVLGEYREELAALQPWLCLDRFDRRALNHALTQHHVGGSPG
jgi:hypothetical protein